MSDLPESWVLAPLRSIATVNPPPPGHLADQDLVSFVPMASVEAESGRMDTVQHKLVAEVRHKGYRYFADGDVLFAKVTPCMENGKIALASGLSNGIGFGSSEFHVVRAGTGMSPRYLMHFLLQRRFRADAQRDMSGTAGLLRVSAKFIEESMVPIPPTAEQERIVSAIEEEFSRLDAGVAALERVRQNLKRMRAAVLQAATSGSLIDPEPSTWRTVAVADLAEVSGGITKNPKRAPQYNPVPFLRVANVPRDGLDLRDVHYIEVFDGELERLRLRNGDLLVVEGNGSPDQIGRSALWRGSIDPCVHQNHLIRIRPGPDVDPEYLNLYWNAPESMRTIQAQASSTSGLHTLSTGKLRAIPVTLPSVSAQREIVEEASRQLTALGGMESVINDQLVRNRSLRSSVLAAAFSGKLVPQRSHDEPASALIERIVVGDASSGQTKRRRVMR